MHDITIHEDSTHNVLCLMEKKPNRWVPQSYWGSRICSYRAGEDNLKYPAKQIYHSKTEWVTILNYLSVQELSPQAILGSYLGYRLCTCSWKQFHVTWP